MDKSNIQSTPRHPCSHESDFGAINAAITGIQETLRDVKELLTSNAALEEQAMQFRSELSNLFDRLHIVELEQATSKGSAKWVDKVIWFILSAGLGALLGAKLSI
ncbi:MAG: hypothetical protein LUG19_13525 [Desulfovibrio sp.]|uniref:hypothetical protein n=1 Tax=Desulfovibrio sp. TaxID=885 RepID=UPI00258EE0CC|nr:hypothetical protein [Desulfovibrio sp.]MCD7985247.1 hypothetical protein [Desulfovibrio sp.]